VDTNIAYDYCYRLCAIYDAPDAALNEALCKLDVRETPCADDLIVYLLWPLQERGCIGADAVDHYVREVRALDRRKPPRQRIPHKP